jgi:pre-mRNA-splicing factor 18
MDLLKAEIERKKAAAAAAQPSKKRYLTASERRAIAEQQAEAEEEAERLRREKKRRRKRNDESDDESGENLVTLLTKRYVPQKKKEEQDHGGDAAQLKRSDSQSSDKQNNLESLKQLSTSDVNAALRRFGLPIRFFGESTNDILSRLAVAMQGREAAMIAGGEEDEFLLDSAHRTRNVFLEKEGDKDEATAPAVKSPKRDEEAASSAATPKEKEVTNDPPKQIYRYFKNLLRQWENDLALRPDNIKRTAAGKNETKTLKQCKDYIRPLFQMCKRRELDDNMQTHLLNIVTYCEAGEFVKAHDAYLDVAIGRAAWPIGVTMVGIHARSGREKIGSANVAHVMNSELHRKYLTSVKRLMSYDQRKRVDVDPSKKVMNL